MGVKGEVRSGGDRKIAVISDTHDLLRASLLDEIAGADEIWHIGDICTPEVVTTLEGIAPLKIVRGNNDKGDWAAAIPESLLFEEAGQWVFLLHNRKELDQHIESEAADLVVCGHSHRLLDETIDGVRYLNPGSCGPRRFSLPISMCWLTSSADSAGFDIEFIELRAE